MSRAKYGRIINGIFLFVLLATLQGCTPGVFPSADVESQEPNDSFDDAQPVSADQLKTVEITGSFSAQNVTDVFLLGNLAEGDTITVEIRTGNSFYSNDLSLGIFDGDQNVAYMADVTTSTMLEEALIHTVRKAGEYYLVIYQPDNDSMTYDTVVTLSSGSAPTVKSQNVYLNFNGASSLVIGGTSFRSLQPFSVINLPINPTTTAAQIVQLVRNDFQNLDITILSSYESSPPAEPYSTVYITASTGDYFGLADSVDWYDENPSDNAVIFAGLLAEASTSTSKFPQLAANVITHETGHLLGLAHTDDNTELMDVSTPTPLLEVDQDFHRAPLATTEFPIGWEDTWELLTFTLGIL
jgi:hypothetical protein